MPIRFAAPPSALLARMAPHQARQARALPANDNAGGIADTMLHAALRHFARHGLAAAEHARQQAITAAEAGDRQTFEWWLDVCRALDRGVAREIDASALAGQ